jgi:hypothetical protein
LISFLFILLIKSPRFSLYSKGEYDFNWSLGMVKRMEVVDIIIFPSLYFNSNVLLLIQNNGFINTRLTNFA